MFDKYTITAFVVMENMAGIESIAHIISEDSISSKIRNKGVA